jgi:murein peptide amidase A
LAEREPAELNARRASRAAIGLLGVVLMLAAASFAASPTASMAATGLEIATTGTPDATGTADSTKTPDATATPSQAPTRTVGRTVRGRRIVLETFGSGRRHILFVGGIHGNEYGGPVTAKFAAYLRTHPSVIPAGTRVDVIAWANPDGTARGRRTNAHNVDLNRNFPSRNWSRKRGIGGASPGTRPGSEPETRAMLGMLASGGYVRVVSMHSRGGILDYDGPGGWTLAKRVSKASRVPVHRLNAYHGSMGSFIPETYRIPIITWELSSRKLTTRVRAGMLAALR